MQLHIFGHPRLFPLCVLKQYKEAKKKRFVCKEICVKIGQNKVFFLCFFASFQYTQRKKSICITKKCVTAIILGEKNLIFWENAWCMWGSASPAQLIHDFEGFPHVPGVKGDWTLSLRSVFLLQRMWTKSSAPEGDISQREKAGNNPYHQYMQDDKQHAPERTIFHLDTSVVGTTSLYKRRNKQHQPELQLNSVSHLYPFTFQAISHTHTHVCIRS